MKIHIPKFEPMLKANEHLAHEAFDIDLGDNVVEVVRCRDCKYWQNNNGGYPHEECRWGKNETPDPDDFYSYGGRRCDYEG